MPTKRHTNMPLLVILLAAITLSLSMCKSMPEAAEEMQEEIIRNPADFEPSPKPVIVAVIDTGYDFDSNWSHILKAYKNLRKPRLCNYGHKDFTGYGLKDNHAHGTHVASTIAQEALDSNYCLVILKFYDPKNPKADNLVATTKAFQRAIDLKVNIINFSGGGEERSEQECLLVKKALDLGITVIAAAGNESHDINTTPYFPAMCDTRIRAVANVDRSGSLVASSNYTNTGANARILDYEMGYNVISLFPNNMIGFMTGTSQATAVFTGKTIKNWKKQ